MTNIQLGGNAMSVELSKNELVNEPAPESDACGADAKCVSSFEMQPHPSNASFCEAMTATMVKSFGLNLHRFSSGQDFQGAAFDIQRFFAIHFGAFELLSSQPDLPRFLQPENRQPDAPIEPEQFTAQLAELELPEPNQPCPVLRNLEWLCDLLHLTSVERKVLLWSYMLNCITPTELPRMLGTVSCADEAHAKQCLATLLDEPVEAVNAIYAEPCRLHAMGLIEVELWHEASILNVYLMPTPTLAVVLETLQQSQEAMLLRLLEPETNWILDNKNFPVGLFDMWYPPSVARACKATVHARPLSADDIAALIRFFTKYQVPTEHCGPLAGRLDFGTIHQAVKRCFIESSRRQLESVTQLDVLQALHAVAT